MNSTFRQWSSTLISGLLALALCVPLVLTYAFADSNSPTDSSTDPFPGHVNVLNTIDPQGHGARAQQAVEDGHDFYYSVQHDQKIALAQKLAKDGWLTIENKKLQHGGSDNYWVRYTEIVPKGDSPKAVLPDDSKHKLAFSSSDISDPITRNISRYVPDDGTFVPPVQGSKIIHLVRNFGLEISTVGGGGGVHNNYQASYTFAKIPTFKYDGTDEGSTDFQNLELQNEFNEQWLPYNHYGNISLFSSDRGPSDDAAEHSDKYNWYWCINPNAADPRDGYYFVREPTRFSGQTNFQDLPALAFTLNMLNQIHSLGDDASPNFRPLYKALIAYFNKNMLDSTHDNDSFEWVPQLTNGDIRKAFDQIATTDGQSHAIGGTTIPVQDDYRAMTKALPTETKWGNNRDFTNLGIAIEFYITHHSQGIPLTHIDWLTGVRQAGILRQGTSFQYDDVIVTRALARLLFAIEFAAKSKGLIQKYDPSEPKIPFKATISNVQQTSSAYSSVVNLQRPSNAAPGDSLLVSATKGVTFQESTQLTPYTPTKHTAFDSFYHTSPTDDTSLQYYTVPATVQQLHVSYTASSVSSSGQTPHPQVRFIYKSMQKVVGEVYSSVDSYEYNQASKHWLVKEYASYNHGMNTDQQVISVTPHNVETPQALALDLFDDAMPQLKTTVSIDGQSSNSTTPVTLRDDKRINHKYALTDTVSYTNMIPGASYNLTGKLYKVQGSEGSYSTTGQALAQGTKRVTVDGAGSGTWSLPIDVSRVTLEPNARYVVFEEATPTQSTYNGSMVQPAKHEDANDNAQTIVTGSEVPQPSITTAVAVNGSLPSLSGSSSGATLHESDVTNNKPVSVTDYVLYKNLKASTTYNVVGKLYEVTTSGSSGMPTVDEMHPVATTPSNTQITTRGTQGFAKVEFGEVHDLQPGKKYVVFETLTLQSPQPGDVWGTTDNPIEHHNPSDAAQTITVEKDSTPPSLSTTVSAGTSPNDMSTASDKTPARVDDANIANGVDVTDTVNYTNVAEGDYVIKAALYKVIPQESDPSKYQVDGSAVAETSKEIHVDSSQTASGSWQVPFGKVNNLHSGSRYVVFETLIKASDKSNPKATPYATHNNPNDTAQTVVITHDFLKSVLPVTGGFGHYTPILLAVVLIAGAFTYLMLPESKRYTTRYRGSHIA